MDSSEAEEVVEIEINKTDDLPASKEPSPDDTTTKEPPPNDTTKEPVEDIDTGVLDNPKSILKKSTVTLGEEDDHQASDETEEKKKE